MRAILSTAPGGPETLVYGDAPRPVCGPTQVVLSVRACGVNYPDVLIIEDRYQHRPPRPFTPGGEASGEIIAIGSEVSGWAVGDRVIAMVGQGGMAEEAVVAASRCVRMPDDMPFTDGAAFLTTFGTSYHALKQRGRLRPGETLLVLGAAGGVGLAAVALGRAMGSRVVAGVSSEDKAALARQHGAETTFVYPPLADESQQRELAQLFKSVCGPAGADVIYDPLGGVYAEAAVRAMAWEGRFLVIGFVAGIPRLPLNLALLKGCAIVGVFYGAFTEHSPAETATNIQELLALYREGAIRPQVTATYPLERAGEAIRHLAERRALGKVVVTI